jgi:hypothetical protein
MDRDLCLRCAFPSPHAEKNLPPQDRQLIIEGIQALRAGDETAAHQCFAGATVNDPSNETAWYWRSRTADSPGEIVECFEALVRMNPDDLSLRENLDIVTQRLTYARWQERPGVGGSDPNGGEDLGASGEPGSSSARAFRGLWVALMCIVGLVITLLTLVFKPGA